MRLARWHKKCVSEYHSFIIARAAPRHGGVIWHRIGYARVSSVGQSLEVQLRRLKQCDKIYQEKRSGANRKSSGPASKRVWNTYGKGIHWS